MRSYREFGSWFLTWMAVLGFIVIGTVGRLHLGLRQMRKLLPMVDSNRLLSKSKLKRSDEGNLRAVVSQRPTEPRVVGDAGPP